MVSEDDDTGGLEKLSRLFENGTLSLPVVPAPQPPAPAPPTVPSSGSHTAPPTSPAPPTASAFGGAGLVTSAPAPAPAPAAEQPAPFSPPPLVPASSAWSGAPAGREAATSGLSATSGVAGSDGFASQPARSASIDATSPSLAGAEAPPPGPQVAPAFGGAAIAGAGRRSAHAASAASGPREDDALAPTALLHASSPLASPLVPAVASERDVAGEQVVASAVPVSTIAVTSEPSAAPAFAFSPSAHAAPAAPIAGAVGVDPGRPLLADAAPADDVDENEIARSTPLEKVMLVLAFVVPPVGLVGSIATAARSSRRRGWAIGVTKAGIAVGIVFSVLAAGGAYAGYKAFRAHQAHDQLTAASTAFCSAVEKDPTLLRVDGGWPPPGSTIQDSLASMQAFVDKWTALAKISPAGVQGGVSSVASAGTQIVAAVTSQRTVDDAQNRSLVEAAVTNSGVAGWHAEYCG